MRFAAVGAVGTAAHYIVLTLLVELAGVPVLTATTAGFVTGAVVNYALNRKFTFSSTASHAAALPKFMTIAAAGAVLNGFIVALLTEAAGLHYLLAQVVATGMVLVLNFAANHFWTFRE
jgi:putative flippase GtrA